MSYKEVLDKMTWSFSRLHSYETCPYYFYLNYIEKRDGIENYYAENGSLMHEIFEKMLKGELKIQDAPGYYIENYENICSKIRQSTMDKTFEKCLDYLCSVDDLDRNKYEVVGVERKYMFKIGEHDATGFVDLLLRNKETDEFILVDHKSANHFLKKDGTVLKNALESFEAYLHQMYLYCKPIYEEYGRYPDRILWHHFKDDGAVTSLDFDIKKYEETMKWAERLIEKIYKEKKFLPRKDWFNCYNICSYRDKDCEYMNEE